VSDNATNGWRPQDAEDLYSLDTWGDGFFAINDKGHV